MKNKKLLYILIPGTLLVWGIIIYKIVVGAGASKTNSIQEVVFAESQQTLFLTDTFSIHPTYRDPFSGKQVKKVVLSSRPIIKKAIAPIIVANWPPIIYGGIVKNQKSNKQLVLVQVNGQSSMMKIGETFNGIELAKVFKDSIEVLFGKEKKVVIK